MSTGNMSTGETRNARAVADLAEGRVVATVEVAAPPERVFAALASNEIVHWWLRPGVFDTTEWAGDVRVGGRWHAAGHGKGGHRYVLEGEFVEVEPAKKLTHTWQRLEAPGAPTTVTYLLERFDGGTRVTLRHEGFTSREACAGTGLGWETSLDRLAEHLDGARR